MHSLASVIRDVGADASAEEQAVVTALADLDEPLMLVVVGEFNAGKSSFINALLGGEYLKTGVTPTTAEVCFVRYGEAATGRVEPVPGASPAATVRLPLRWLREICVVDTPGTNAVIREHQRITEHFVPRADLVLFITSAFHPFAETERRFLQTIRAYGKKIVLIMNKVDMLATSDERAQVHAFVADNATAALGASPPAILAVSARTALQAKLAGQAHALAESGFVALETFIVRQLGADGRHALKLASPLGAAERLASQHSSVIQARLAVLRADAERLKRADAFLAEAQVLLTGGMATQLGRVDAVLHSLAARADDFFDRTLVLTRLHELANASRLRAAFEQDVVKDLAADLERSVGGLIEWFVNANHEQWVRVRATLEPAPPGTGESVPPADSEMDARVALLQRIGASDVSRRTQLLAEFSDESLRVLAAFDRAAESAKLVAEIKNTLLATLGLQGAAGLGAALVAAMTDVSGTLMLGLLATSGLFLLPYRRSSLKSQMRAKTLALQTQLNTALVRVLQSELARNNAAIRAAIAPYSAFVVREGKAAEALAARLAALEAQRVHLAGEVARLAQSGEPGQR